MQARALRIVRELEGLECAFLDVPKELAAYVHSWAGYSERTLGILRRRELPISTFVVIIEFGPPIQVYESGSETRFRRYQGGFVAGLTETFTICQHDGYQAGIELRLTPLGARAIFDMPLTELSETVVHLRDLLPRSESTLNERLEAAADWGTRFSIVQQLLMQRIRAGRASCRKTRWAVAQIQAAQGRIEVNALARELGMSRKHLATLFHDGVGFTPKAYASIVRFEHLVEHLKVDRSLSWAVAANTFGYADQAHMAREVKRLSGLTPSQLLSTFRSVPAAAAE